jgi:hypothetical protein
MEINDIWHNLYQKGYSEGLSTFNTAQKHLWFYIDFTIYVANGGGEGFLYNHSPCEATDNHYQPFIDSFAFFGYKELAGKLSEYNILYASAIALYQNNVTKSLNDFLQEFDLQILNKEIVLAIEEIVKDETYIYRWIEEHKDILLH